MASARTLIGCGPLVGGLYVSRSVAVFSQISSFFPTLHQSAGNSNPQAVAAVKVVIAMVLHIQEINGVRVD
ncbi:MAG: hypothetical protein HOO93_01680 [Methyloglobulus sp.]|nr:hypothetical protein [Methyloglobulus sp.]